jgi:hypothetical protein
VGDDFPVIIPLDVVWKPAAGHLYAGRSLVATFRVGGIRQVDHIEYSHIDEYDRLYFAAVANED